MVLRAGFGLIDPVSVHCLIYYFNSREWRSMQWDTARRYDELSLKMCTNSVWGESVGNDNVNYFYWTSASTMPELVEINLVLDDGDRR